MFMFGSNACPSASKPVADLHVLRAYINWPGTHLYIFEEILVQILEHYLNVQVSTGTRNCCRKALYVELPHEESNKYGKASIDV